MSLLAAWDGHKLWLGEGDAEPVCVDAESIGDPQLADSSVTAGCNITVLLLPMEQLLVRPFALPLANARLLDREIVAQELDELTGEEMDDWWITWAVDRSSAGVAGMAFAMPESIRQEMADSEVWAHCELVAPDGWVRLAHHIKDYQGQRCAVVDADVEGVFAGVYEQGCWLGMRRINRKRRKDESFLQDILRSLTAMGFDTSSDDLLGQMDEVLVAGLSDGVSWWRGGVINDLPSRQYANIAAMAENMEAPTVNFRRGAWAVRSNWAAGFSAWRRAAVMAAVFVLLVLGLGIAEVVRLDYRAESLHADIEAAFHRGLPEEKVMLDAIAQLRAAAGGGTATAGANELLLQLQDISAVKSDAEVASHWQLQELDFKSGEIRLFGMADDLATVNRLRDLLTAKLAVEVVIEDTELSSGKVRFRMRWS